MQLRKVSPDILHVASSEKACNSCCGTRDAGGQALPPSYYIAVYEPTDAKSSLLAAAANYHHVNGFVRRTNSLLDPAAKPGPVGEIQPSESKKVRMYHCLSTACMYVISPLHFSVFCPYMSSRVSRAIFRSICPTWTYILKKHRGQIREINPILGFFHRFLINNNNGWSHI